MKTCEHCGERIADIRDECPSCNKKVKPLEGKERSEYHNKEFENKQKEILRDYLPLTIEQIKNSGKLASLGTIKIIRLYEDGFTIKGLKKDIAHDWPIVKTVHTRWNHTIINVVGHQHDVNVNISFKGYVYDTISENFMPHSLYIDISSRSIKKFLATLSVLSEIHDFNWVNH